MLALSTIHVCHWLSKVDSLGQFAIDIAHVVDRQAWASCSLGGMHVAGMFRTCDSRKICASMSRFPR